MTRFSKGTTDHDGDGRMGGSRKGDKTMAAPKASKDAPAKKAVKAKQEAVQKQFDEADAKAQPDAEIDIEALQAGLAVRGF